MRYLGFRHADNLHGGIFLLSLMIAVFKWSRMIIDRQTYRKKQMNHSSDRVFNLCSLSRPFDSRESSGMVLDYV